MLKYAYMGKTSLDSQIKACHELLQFREDTDPAFLSKEIKELRHKIMYVHLRVEQTLGIILAHNILRPELKKKNTPKIVEDFKRVVPLLDNMEFYSKIKAIQALDLVPRTLIDLLQKINDHRKYFSHPASYRDKISEYKEPEKQLATLKQLEKTLTELDKYISEKKLFLTD